MRLCYFRGCDRFPHSTGLHTRWDAERGESVPLAEQRTPEQIRRDNADDERREHADRIAREILALNLASPEGAQKSDAALRHLTYTGDRVREMLTAAALQALTETENAR